MIAALSAAGVAPGKFLFEGFAPARAEARRKRLSALAGAAHTLVFYEAPHRIKAFLADAATIFGAGREASIARELTKKFETIRHGTLGGLIDWMESDPDQGKGEFVVVIAGAGEEHTDSAELTVLLRVLLKSLSLKQTVQVAAELTRAPRNQIYDLAVSLQDKVSLRDD